MFVTQSWLRFSDIGVECESVDDRPVSPNIKVFTKKFRLQNVSTYTDEV